jgi:hypothetical protein
MSTATGEYNVVLEMGISHSRSITNIERIIDETVEFVVGSGDTTVNTYATEVTINDFTALTPDFDIITINKMINEIALFPDQEVTLDFVAQIVIYRQLGITPQNSFRILDKDINYISFYSRLAINI